MKRALNVSTTVRCLRAFSSFLSLERERKNQVAVEMTSTTSRRSIAQKDDFYKGDLRDVKKSGKTSSSSLSSSLFLEWRTEDAGRCESERDEREKRDAHHQSSTTRFSLVLVDKGTMRARGKRVRLINVSRHVCVCTINTTKKQDELLRAFFFLSLSFLSLSLS